MSIEISSQIGNVFRREGSLGEALEKLNEETLNDVEEALEHLDTHTLKTYLNVIANVLDNPSFKDRILPEHKEELKPYLPTLSTLLDKSVKLSEKAKILQKKGHLYLPIFLDIIADNLQEIFPKLVQTLQDETITDAEGNPINNVKQYDVPGLVHVLLAAFKHSQSLIDTLTAKVNLPFLVYNLDKTNETILPQSIIGDQSDSNNGTWVLKSFSTGSDIYRTSGEFVIPSNGVYEVILSLHLSTSVNTSLSVQFNKNGIAIGLASKSMLSNTTDTFTGQITTDFLNGDILTIKQVNAANNAKVTTNPENCCQLHIRQLS